MALVKGYDNRSIEQQLLALGLGHLMPCPGLFGIAFIPLKAFQVFKELVVNTKGDYGAAFSTRLQRLERPRSAGKPCYQSARS
jgi:hypothetical protein